MPVTRRDDRQSRRTETGNAPVQRWDYRIPLRNGETASREKVVLNVDDQERVVAIKAESRVFTTHT